MDLDRLRDEVVSAACGWRGALRAQATNPDDRADVIEAEQRARLIAAVDAYLNDEEG